MEWTISVQLLLNPMRKRFDPKIAERSFFNLHTKILDVAPEM